MKLIPALIASLSIGCAIADARPAPRYGYLQATTPVTWAETSPDTGPSLGAYCELYNNGALLLATQADASGVCSFGYMTRNGEMTVIAYQTVNTVPQTNLPTAQGSVYLSVPSVKTIVVVTQ